MKPIKVKTKRPTKAQARATMKQLVDRHVAAHPEDRTSPFAAMLLAGHPLAVAAVNAAVERQATPDLQAAIGEAFARARAAAVEAARAPGKSAALEAVTSYPVALDDMRAIGVDEACVAELEAIDAQAKARAAT